MIYIIFLFYTQVFSIPVSMNDSRENKYIIAESSYLTNDLFRAEYVFKNLIGDKTIDKYTYLAIERLFSIAEKIDDSKLFAQMHNFLKKVDKSKTKDYSQDSLNYTLGKIFFHKGYYKTSYSYLKEVPKESAYYPKALYFVAASSAVMGKYQPALIIFDRIANSQGISPQLRDISTIAKARILMILKNFDDALIEYQKISTYSTFYVSSVKESVWAFIENKKYDLALSLLESLSFVNKVLYLEGENLLTDDTESLSGFDLMTLKNIQGDIYLQNSRFNDALSSYNQVLAQYDTIKEVFKKELNKLRFSDDLSQILSHPTEGGVPRSLTTNFKSNLLYSNELYSLALRDWTTQEEKVILEKSFNLYFSLLKEVYRINNDKSKTSDDFKVLAQYKKLNVLLKKYLDTLLKLVYVRLDEIGLKAQLGVVDLVWKIKDEQSSEIVKIQVQKQDFSDVIDEKFKGLVK